MRPSAEGPESDARPAGTAALVVDLVADPATLREVRRRVRDWSASAALGPDTTDDLLLAVGEAAANAVEHAYAGRPGRLRVEAAVVDGHGVAVTVADEGRWRTAPADPGSRGRGLLLLRELSAGSVTVERRTGGTVVRFAIPLPGGGTDGGGGRPAGALEAPTAASG